LDDIFGKKELFPEHEYDRCEHSNLQKRTQFRRKNDIQRGPAQKLDQGKAHLLRERTADKKPILAGCVKAAHKIIIAGFCTV